MSAHTPATDNVVFYDTEFSSLDAYTGEILSLGIVKMNGEELYLELETEAELTGWVQEHVVPFLTEEKVSRA